MSAPVRLPVLADTEAPARPVTRGDCAGGPRPCPWVSCSHHLALGMLERASGRPVLDDGAVLAALETMPQTCALDVADEGGATLEAVAEPWGVTRERIRQIEAKALAKLPRRSETLRDHLDEEPSPELRPTAGGAARPVEERRLIEAPAQHAHLPTPAAVRASAEAMWCPWMGAAITGALCARRHTARREKSANAGAGPVYPSCASCADGAAVAARVGRLGELVPLRVAVPRIDWMGEGDDRPAANDITEETMARREKAKTKRSGGKGRIVTVDLRTCRVWACTDDAAPFRETLDHALRPLCTRHRNAAQKERVRRQVDSAEAVAIVMARASNRKASARSGAVEAPLPVAFDAPVVEAPAQGLFEGGPEIAQDLRTSAGDELASLRADRDALALRLRAADERIEELEGQMLADATSREPSSRPLARLATLFGAIDPHSRGASVSVVLGAEGSRAELRDLECLGSGEVVHHADGDTPDEALAALVAVVEGVARVRVEALTAALEGRR